MLYSLDIRDPKSTPIAWLAQVEALAKPRVFAFKPGLNVLWGRNGSGKTTVLKLLTTLLHCGQSGLPSVTQTSARELVGSFDAKERVSRIKKAIVLKHDGQGVRHFDPSHAVGLMSGGGGFDDEFFSMGVVNAMFKGSSGQTALFRFEEILGSIVHGRVPTVEWKITRDRVNSTWGSWLALAEHFLKGNAAKGPPTVLLDEPDRSYDLNKMVGVWRLLRAFAPKTQFIVASHSLFALNIPEAHYIEMSPGYLAGSLKALRLLPTWAEEKPQPPPLPPPADRVPKTRRAARHTKAQRP